MDDRTRPRRWLLVVLAAVLLTALAAPSANAAFGVSAFDGQVTADSSGAPLTQAGGHPFDATTWIDFNTSGTGESGEPLPDGNVKDLIVDLPQGFVGDPRVGPRCSEDLLEANACPANAQVGFLTVTLPVTGFGVVGGGIYNIIPRDGVVADFGANVLGSVIHLVPTLRADGTYGLRIASRNTTQSVPLTKIKATFWGVPADPAHDALRSLGPGTCFELSPGQMFCTGGFQSSDQPLRPFLTNPTDCSAGPLTTSLRANSWQDPSTFVEASFVSHLPPAYPAAPAGRGTEQGVTGCDQLSDFDPTATVTPTSARPDAPTGLTARISFPDDPGMSDPGRNVRSQLKDVRVTLPEGMTINPTAADGLAACSDAELGLGSDGAATCPPASKIGTVEASSPLLERLSRVTGLPMLDQDGEPVMEVLTGGVYIRSQASVDPESGEMFRLALVLESEDRGVRVKLPGHVRADAGTGQLVASFRDNPQLPISEVEVRLKSGERAPLSMPRSCGVKTVQIDMTSWGGQTRSVTDSFTADCAAAPTFQPGFVAGSLIPAAGAFSPFAVRISRTQGSPFLSGIRTELPKGLLADLSGVDLCPASVAGDGAPGRCPAGSRVGTVDVEAGSGQRPFLLRGDAYLTGPYKGAPYGIAVQVDAKAGPFDLGTVKVRAALPVDPETVQAGVVSDLLPQVVKGVPVRLRGVDVDIDRSGFTTNPTSCSAKRVAATLTSIDGDEHRANVPFRVSDCASLGFRPRLRMRLVGRRQMRSGGHPVLRAILSQGSGQANIRAAKVTLPRSMALDSKNSVDPKLLCDHDGSLKAECPRSSTIGRASLRTPLLNEPLSGPVHLVQGIRFENGNRIRSLPTLLVKLRGEVAINLRSQTDVDSKDRLVSTFPSVPDARAGRFHLRINGGRKGVLVVTKDRRGRIDLCHREQTALVEIDGHNGKGADYAARVKTPCAARRKR